MNAKDSPAAPPPVDVTVRQVSCVSLGGRGVLIEGPSGSGKSSLALALIDRGATLVGDDGVLLSTEGGRLLAHPHPNTRGLLEVRNLGIITYPVCETVPVALLLLLDPAAPRFIEEAGQGILSGIAIPTILLWPDSPVLAVRAELALARYGLPLM